MTREEKLEVIINKFDNDVKYYSRIHRLLIAFDQFFNVLFWNGSMDETISGHIGRKLEANTANKFEKLLAKCLGKLQKYHCIKSIGE